MTAVIERADLSALTSRQLAGALADGPDNADVLAELRRRDALSDERRRQARLRAAEPWQAQAYAQYLAADEACRGHLLSRRGQAKGVDPWPALWTGPQATADAWASYELQEFWQANPRITVTEYQRQERRSMEVYLDGLDRDAADAVRHEGSAIEGGAADRADRRRDAVPVAAARAGTQGHGTEAGPVRDAQPVRPGRAVTELAARAAAIRSGSHWTSPGYSPAPYAAQPAPVAQVAVRERGTVVTAGRAEIDGDQVLRYIYTYLKRFAMWGSDAEVVCAALWIAHTYARNGDGMPIWQYCARLGILGPSGSGKSWKSRLIGKLACSGEILVEPTKPAFIDLCAENHTIIITEADEQFRSPGRSRGVLAVINASYEPDRTSTRKQGGVAVKIPLFGHIVLDGIDEVLLSPNRPDLHALMSRCIRLMAVRAPDGYRPPRFDGQARAIAAQIGQRCAAWMAQEVAAGMADDVPVVPEHLGNRPFALWEPLFMVALRADKGDKEGPWSAACADACEVLEAGGPVIDESGEDGPSELDRQMAEWGDDL